MRVWELIAALKTFPDHFRVVVDGYEGGLSDIDPLQRVTLVLDYNDCGCYGPHANLRNTIKIKARGKKQEEAVYLPTKPRE